jgi:hypothetical protein
MRQPSTFLQSDLTRAEYGRSMNRVGVPRMILYHFTGLEYLDAIMNEGLSKGDVPTAERAGREGVWLTTDHDPFGHGLSDGEPLRTGLRVANKRAVRISVKIPSHDRQLVSWMKWGHKHCDPALFERLNKSGGGKCKTWFVYFGVIAPAQFLDIEFLTAEPPKIVIATLPDASKVVVYGSGVVQAIRMTGRAVQGKVEYRPVASAEEAEALALQMRPRAINPFF